MAEFIDRHRAVKDEKKVKQRLDTTVRYTKKKRYGDAADEDKKVIADSQKLETVLNNMQANRQGKAELKEAKRERRANKKASKRIPKEKKSSEENGSFDFSGLAK